MAIIYCTHYIQNIGYHLCARYTLTVDTGLWCTLTFLLSAWTCPLDHFERKILNAHVLAFDDCVSCVCTVELTEFDVACKYNVRVYLFRRNILTKRIRTYIYIFIYKQENAFSANTQ